jgi:hypothetical protein
VLLSKSNVIRLRPIAANIEGSTRSEIAVMMEKFAAAFRASSVSEAVAAAAASA